MAVIWRQLLYLSLFQRNSLGKKFKNVTAYEGMGPSEGTISRDARTAEILEKLRHFQLRKDTILQSTNYSNFLPKLKCAAALLLYSLALRSSSLQFTSIPSV